MQDQWSSSRMSLVERELEIVQAIDRIRDTMPVPEAMFAGIVGVLADRFQMDVCLLYLLNRETAALELKAVNDRGSGWSLGSDELSSLARQAMHGEQVAIWRAEDVLSKDVLQGLASAVQLVTIPIVMFEPLGVVLMARPVCPSRPTKWNCSRRPKLRWIRR